MYTISNIFKNKKLIKKVITERNKEVILEYNYSLYIEGKQTVYYNENNKPKVTNFYKFEDDKVNIRTSYLWKNNNTYYRLEYYPKYNIKHKLQYKNNNLNGFNYSYARNNINNITYFINNIYHYIWFNNNSFSNII